MAAAPFKLSSVLFGHSLDVRSVAVTKDNCIVSGSRDKTAKFWKPTSENSNCFVEEATLKGHKNFVSCVCVLEPTANFPQGLIITGGNDHLICLYKIESDQPLAIFKGHSNTVCNLSPGLSPDTFLSSSWDCSAKLWNVPTKAAAVTFSGHQAAVWAAVQLKNSNVITAGADKDIVIWKSNGEKLKTLKGHTDCVRGLAVLNDNFFLSVANDASIRQWTIEGDCVNTYYGHKHYIYNICIDRSTNDGSFITCGEDYTVRYWQNGENTQTINLPAQSVWCVGSLTNGDIVAGSSDGVVRVFTQDPGRVAEERLLNMFQEEVNNVIAQSTQELGGVKVSDLPGREVLFEPGKSDGQTKLVREDGGVMCYSWSASEGKWNKIGDVMGAAGGTQATSGKVLYEGKEFDYVFSVDIEDGKPPIKLPYNRDEDPWFAAQNFIHKNNLPQVYLEQVANFIITNSQTQPQQPISATTHVDPYTGTSRYIPNNETNQNFASTGKNVDPFTGAHSYSTSMATAGTEATVYTPQRSYVRFDQANIQIIQNKLKEFNSKQGDSNGNVDDAILENLAKLATDGQISPDIFEILFKLLNWPKDMIFPLLDITRLAIRHPEVNNVLCNPPYSDFLIDILQHCTSPGCSVMANQMLCFRILSNMFLHPSGEKLALQHKAIFLTNAQLSGTDLNKNVQVALSTVVLNYCIAFHKVKDISGLEILTNTIPHLMPRFTEPEAHFRLLVATGTLIKESADIIKPTLKAKLTNDRDFKQKLTDICEIGRLEQNQESSLNKMISCAIEISNLLQ